MYLNEVASDEFVLIKSDWPAEMALQLIESMQPPHVIVHRSEPEEEYYYLYALDEAIERLSPWAGFTVMAAFNLHEYQATQIGDAFDEAEEAPDRTVVLDEGRVVGFLDATVPPTGSTRIGPDRGGSPGMAPPEAVPRFLQADFPEKVPQQEIASLLVSLSAEQPLAAGLPLALPAGSRVDIIVQPKKGFALEGKREGSLTIAGEAETLPLLFRLRAVEPGPGKIRVLAFHDGSPLGALTLAPTVTPAGATTDTSQPPRSHQQPVAPLQVGKLPDLQLLILEGQSGGNPAFTIFLTAANPNLGLHFKPFGPVQLRMPPLAYFDDFFQGIENLPLSTPEERQIAEVRLASKGLSLFNSLFPDDLKVLLWDLRQRITTVEVESQEPWIPWELCKLEGKESGQFVEGPFLCEAYAITRWIPGIGSRKNSLSLRNIGLVVPADSNLPFAPAESNYLRSLANGGRRVTQVPASFLEVRSALASGDHDCWHFTGHALFRSSDPSRSGIMLEGGFAFTPDELSGAVKNLGKAQPLVFLNACQVGRSALGLTDIGGFAAQFLRAGAAAFVGTYWSIFDQPALVFAETFYDNLLAGETISQATRLARKKIQPLGDPTWLAYTVYADPSAVAA